MKAHQGAEWTTRTPAGGRVWGRCSGSILGALPAILLFLGACHLVAGSAITQYPEAVIRATGGRQPFTPVQITSPYEFQLNPVWDAMTGFVYGAAVKLRIEGLGEKLLLVDTAARGLLLKENVAGTADWIHAPEWAGSGPGIQTGKFRVFERLWRDGFSLGPVVAEVFPASGYARIDGILSTQVLEPWLVQLDLAKKKIVLQPHSGRTTTESGREWPARLERNWWIVTTKIAGNPARMLLDSGAGRTRVTDDWVQANLPRSALRKRSRDLTAGGTFGPGDYRIELDELHSGSTSLSIMPAGQIPPVNGAGIDGLIGYDVLRHLAIELDYRSGKVRFLR